jgi:hypothetical protein
MLSRLARKYRVFWKLFAAYIAVAGLFTFSMFILEEAFQTVMFGTWPAVDSGDWKLAKHGADTMEKVNWWLKGTTYVTGWVQPFALIAYGNYGRAGDYYIAGLRAKIFANQPGVFDGEEMEFAFEPIEVEPAAEGYWLKARGVAVFTRVLPTGADRFRIRGMVHAREGRVEVRASSLVPEHEATIPLPRYNQSIRGVPH